MGKHTDGPDWGSVSSCPEYLMATGVAYAQSYDCERELNHRGKHKMWLHDTSGRDVVISWKSQKKPKLRSVDDD